MNIVHTQHSYKDVGSQLVLLPYTRTKQKDVSEGGRYRILGVDVVPSPFSYCSRLY